MTQSERKKILRKEVLMKRDRMEEEERKKASMLMCERILGHQWFYRADTILGFVSFGSEIDTKELLREALHSGKKVFVPGIKANEMHFFRMNSFDDLSEGYCGIPEVMSENAERYCYREENAEKTLMIMPGVAFDPMKNRIGYGKGFYDRYLSGKQALQERTIAVGYRCQMVEEIPSDEKDIRPYQILLF